jgi:hypothetical protein
MASKGEGDVAKGMGEGKVSISAGWPWVAIPQEITRLARPKI